MMLTRVVSRDEHLATDQRDLDVVNPDLVGAIQGHSITTPDVLWVELCDVDVLDDDCVPKSVTSHLLTANDIPFLAPFAIRRPLPLSTPLDPTPMMLLLDPTLIPATPALS